MDQSGQTMTINKTIDQRLKEWVTYIDSSIRFGSSIPAGSLEDLRALLREIEEANLTK